MALTDQTFVIETVAATGADHASLSSFANNFNSSSLDLVTGGTVAVAMVDSFVDTGGQAGFTSWTTDVDNIIIVAVPISLPLSAGAGTFTQGETVTGGTSGAAAMVIDQNTAYHGVGGTDTLIVAFVDGAFEDGETVTGGTSAATGTVNGSLDLSLYHGGISRDVNGGVGYVIDGQDSVDFGVIRLTGGAEFARFYGIEVKRGAGGGVRHGNASLQNLNDVQQFWNCISHHNTNDGFRCTDTECLFVNCLSYQNTRRGFLGTASGNESAAYFCGSYANGENGFHIAGRREMRNCWSGDNTGDDYAFETSEDFCISSDATASGTSSKTNITFTTDTSVTGAIFANLTDGSEDFTPQEATGSAVQELADAGTAILAYEADAAFNARSDPPEIGAFEIVASGGSTVDVSATILADATVAIASGLSAPMSAALAANATMSIADVISIADDVAVSANATASTSNVISVDHNAAIAAVAALSTSGPIATSVSATIAADATLATLANKVVLAAVAVDASSTLDATAVASAAGAVTVAADAVASAASSLNASDAVSISAAGTLASQADAVAAVAAAISANAAMAATSSTQGDINEAATITAAGLLSSQAAALADAAASLQSAATMAADANIITGQSATLSGNATATSLGNIAAHEQAAIAASGAMSASGAARALAALSIAADAVSDARATMLADAAATLSAASTLTSVIPTDEVVQAAIQAAAALGVSVQIGRIVAFRGGTIMVTSGRGFGADGSRDDDFDPISDDRSF